MDREARNYWKQQRRKMLRRSGLSGLGTAPLTKILIGLMILTWLAITFAPSVVYAVESRPGGIIVAYALAVLSPGSLFGLILDGIFVWLVGSGVEPTSEWWQYLLVFFGSAIIAAVILDRFTGGFPLTASLAAFGLAGAYVRIMATRRIGGAARWALSLLLINLVLSGFQATTMIGLVAAFGSGFVLAAATQMGGR